MIRGSDRKQLTCLKTLTIPACRDSVITLLRSSMMVVVGPVVPKRTLSFFSLQLEQASNVLGPVRTR